jgi:hypothetical protein
MQFGDSDCKQMYTPGVLSPFRQVSGDQGREQRLAAQVRLIRNHLQPKLRCDREMRAYGEFLLSLGALVRYMLLARYKRIPHASPRRWKIAKSQSLEEKTMTSLILKTLSRLHMDEAGQGLVEYALILVLVAFSADGAKYCSCLAPSFALRSRLEFVRSSAR